jgi:antitoxin component YwqK of YwqJK toxin-antitoxin module
VNGVPHGVAKTWYKNNRSCSETNYVNGKKCGKHTEWDYDGTKREYYYMDDIECDA